MKRRASRPILAVEDDPVIRRSIEKALHGLADVRFAPTGKAAIEWLGDGVLPAFVLLDFMLPDMDGMQVLSHVRAMPRTAAVPVVIFSSVTDPAKVRAALAAGANSWVDKTE